MAGGLMGRVWAEIGANNSELLSKTKQSKDALKDLANSGGESASNLGSSFLSVASVIAGVLAAVKVGKEVFDFAAEGAQIASLKQASVKLADAYGTNMSSIVASVKKASFNTITEYDAMKAANLAMTMGVSTSATEIGNLMEIAIMRGRAFGLTTEEAFNRISVGIGRRSIKILDDLGFNIKNATSTQDLFNKVLEQGNLELGKMGGLAVDVSVPFQRVTTSFKEFMDTAKVGAAYGLVNIIGTPSEIREIYTELAKGAQTYDAYYQAKLRAGGAYVDDSGQVVGPSEGAMTRMGWNISERKKDEVAARMQNVNAQIAEKEAAEELNYERQLEIGLAGEANKAWETYNDEIKKAEKDTKKQAIAINNLNESYENFILSSLKGLGVDSQSTMGIAYAFGEIDDNSIAAFSAIEKINKMFDVGSDAWVGALTNVRDRMDDLNTIQFADKSLTVRINYLVSGSTQYAPSSGSPSLGGKSGSGSNLYTGLKHGGVIFGGAHGMIVSPGYGNDGMLVAVSSGERMEVTPAGNKSSPDDELLGEIKAMRGELKGLPIAIRDAVLLVA